MLKLELDASKAEAEDHFQILFKGFDDGTSGWDMSDYQPAWNFLEKLEKAVKDATVHPS